MQRLKRQQELEAQSAALRMASELGDASKVRALVMEGAADIDAGGKHGLTALHRAAERERVDVVRILLQAGADHSKRTNHDGQTALMLAAQRGSSAVCKLLIQAGADVNAQNSKGWDAAMFASARRHLDVTLLLARANGNVEHCSSGGVTANDLLAVWHGDKRTADCARHATHNSGRAKQQQKLWEEERARQAEQIGETAEEDLKPPSDLVTQSTDDPATPQDLAPASPRDIEGDVRLLLAATEAQTRQEEQARIESLLQRSRQPISYQPVGQTGSGTESSAASTQLVQSPAAMSAGELTDTLPISTTGEPAPGAVASPVPNAATEDLVAPEVAPVTTTVRDQDHAARQAERRVRIEAMRRELEVSLAS